MPIRKIDNLADDVPPLSSIWCLNCNAYKPVSHIGFQGKGVILVTCAGCGKTVNNAD